MARLSILILKGEGVGETGEFIPKTKQGQMILR
jgi:hypothetical protein